MPRASISTRLAFFFVLPLAAASGCGADDAAFTGAGGAGGGSTSDSSTVGATGTGGGGGPAGSGPSSSASTGSGDCPSFGDPCTVCEAKSCTAEYCKCYGNAACVQLAQCDVPCAPNDLACHQACWTANVGGISDGALLVDCAAKQCDQGCPGLTPLTPCQKCLYQTCPAPMNLCVSNPECTLLLYCMASCTDPGCLQDCYAQHPDGTADAAPVTDCVEQGCAPSCS